VGWLSFFFHAEDGIRDDLVTGVQTCALPILSRCEGLKPSLTCRNVLCFPRVNGSLTPTSGTFPAYSARSGDALAHSNFVYCSARSEERRVGEECSWFRPENHREGKLRVYVDA